MELGVLIENCPCMAKDLLYIFNSYWNVANTTQLNREDVMFKLNVNDSKNIHNQRKPLNILYNGVPTDLYIAVCIQF